MNKTAIAFLLAFAVCLLWFFERSPKDVVQVSHETIVNEKTEQTTAAEVSTQKPRPETFNNPVDKPATPKTAQVAVQDFAKPEPPPNPYQIDRFSLRKIDLPLPKSLAELFANVTDYELPMLPQAFEGQEPMGDGSLLTGVCRGYYELADRSLKRLPFDHTTGGFYVSLEDANGEYHEWSDKAGEITVKNFAKDRYSLLLFLPDKKVLYFKFRRDEKSRAKLRSFAGWLMSSSDLSANAFRAAVTESGALRLQSPDDPQGWPSQDTIRKILPSSLPPKL